MNIKGILTKEKAYSFITPLKDLLAVGIDKVILKFYNKKIKIGCVNKNSTIIAKVEYNESLFSGFEQVDEFEYGIYNLSEFISMLDIFKEGYILNITPKEFKVSKDDNEVIFIGGDINKINNKVPDQDITLKLNNILNFEWNKKNFTPFIKAMSKLNQPHVCFKNINGKLNISVCDKDIRTNTFNYNINVDITRNIKIHIFKVFLEQIVCSSVGDFQVNMYDELIKFEGHSDSHNIIYYVSTTK